VISRFLSFLNQVISDIKGETGKVGVGWNPKIEMMTPKKRGIFKN
jgi:hypothetical protein